MDFWKAVHDLHAERQRVDSVIATLEAIQRGEKPARKGRRGRKTMPPDERRIVAERMRAYWARRRGATAGGER